MSDYCLTPNELLFSNIMEGTSYMLMRWWQWCLLCTRSTCCVGLAHWNNSLWIDMSLHLDILFWFWASQSLFLLLGAACSVEKEQIPISVCFDPTKFWTNDLLYSRLACWPLPHWCGFYKKKPWYNATFNNISAISCQPVLLVEETELPRPAASHWQILSHNVVCIESGIRTHKVSRDRHW